VQPVSQSAAEEEGPALVIEFNASHPKHPYS